MAAPVVINIVNCETRAERKIVFELLLSLKKLLLDDESKRRRGSLNVQQPPIFQCASVRNGYSEGEMLKPKHFFC